MKAITTKPAEQPRLRLHEISMSKK